MRRSICLTEPNIALAGEMRNWKFSYTPSPNLPKGTKCKFDMLMQNRPTDWEIPNPDSNAEENGIWLEIPTGKSIYPVATPVPNHIHPAFEFTLPIDIKAGENLIIHLGSKSGDR